jgi:hypothetical protein
VKNVSVQPESGSLTSVISFVVGLIIEIWIAEIGYRA